MIDMSKRMIITYVAGGAVGALAGFLYYRFVGCRTGSCPLTSTLYGSVLYGMVLGSLLVGVVVAR
jgi:branched-subunit amino acid ABC-type transport system permease component